MHRRPVELFSRNGACRLTSRGTQFVLPLILLTESGVFGIFLVYVLSLLGRGYSLVCVDPSGKSV